MRDAELLSTQQSYYRARAPEYDAWWHREGRYDRGAVANARWFAETDALERALAQFRPRGDILELACGTGLWTRRLVPDARRLTAVDAAPEMLARNRARLSPEMLARNPARMGERAVDYLQADLFEWRPPPDAYDVCFFGFWLSHVPESRFEPFWNVVDTALRPRGRVFFIDSDRSDRSTAADHRLAPVQDETTVRRLDDGREFRIVKRFYSPQWLESRLAELGWRVSVHRTGEFFIHGAGTRDGEQ